MFSNFTPYRYSGQPLAASTELPQFVPCVPSQAESIGFVPSDKHLIVRIEHKVVPAQALKRRVDELAAQVFEQTARKPSKKALAELKEQAHLELLPRAFPKTKDVHVTFLADPHSGARNLLLIGSTSQGDLDAVTTLLIQNCEGLVIQLLLTAQQPALLLASWLLEGYEGTDFRIGRSCALSNDDGAVRYDKHTLDTDNVRDHIRAGKAVDALALEYEQRVEFTMTAGLQFKSVSLGDLAFEGQEQHTDNELAADAELFLWRAELRPLLDAVIDNLGGVAS